MLPSHSYPSGQDEQFVCPAEDVRPHAHSRFESRSVSGHMEPAGHTVQLACPPTENVPGVHSRVWGSGFRVAE